MNKILPVFFTLAVILTLAGCSNTSAKHRDISSEKSDVSKNILTDDHNKSQTDRVKETKIMKNLNIRVGDKTFTATLEDNDTAKALVEQLPLTVDMSELNGNEKYYYLSGNLRADKSTSPGRINEGDLMLYGDNCLVIFYKTFNTSYKYVKLGHIDNTTGLFEALGSGSVKVIFSFSE
ncbi:MULTISPECIES: cyclophilin-like fold protein [unclassified Bacillus (in: firmicutes)]|uniref:cyclophilin-like fold protein n=1 Tax=unclassified Bacillus (in: firmicutes) TaxID=185979 RepID=UPI0015964FD0|nr:MULTISPECIES: cyclophilin-like fold protein [unclassified Bacillus (in: firmicutes)]